MQGFFKYDELVNPDVLVMEATKKSLVDFLNWVDNWILIDVQTLVHAYVESNDTDEHVVAALFELYQLFAVRDFITTFVFDTEGGDSNG